MKKTLIFITIIMSLLVAAMTMDLSARGARGSRGRSRGRHTTMSERERMVSRTSGNRRLQQEPRRPPLRIAHPVRDIENPNRMLNSQQETKPTNQEPEKPEPVKPTRGYINGREWVDMGLPSGVKWATCNVGASKPEQYGAYFAWGEVRPKTDYSENNSITYKKNFSEISGKRKNDAARYFWGSTWRIPTKAEFQELLDNCSRTWTSVGGIYGSTFTSNINGQSIFLPSGGLRNGTSAAGFIGTRGYYWSSTPYDNNTNGAWSVYFGSGGFDTNNVDRYNGLCIRPVAN